MTTNSPNPFVGDVQALIADCQAEIAELEKRLTTWGEAWIPYLQSKLKRQQVALSALTAEPETPACFVTYWPDTEDESDKPHSESNEACARRIAGEIGGYVRQCFVVDDGLKVYATPPAQLLRPVELPEAKDKSQGWKIDPDYLCRIAEHIGESEEHGAAPCLEHIEAVLLAVNEVKS